jgi:hypothetical protein
MNLNQDNVQIKQKEIEKAVVHQSADIKNKYNKQCHNLIYRI